MGKLVYFALCFLFVFMVIAQLSAAADGHNLQSHGEEIEGSGRNNGEVSEERNGVSKHNNVKNYVPRPSRRILRNDHSSDETPPSEPPPDEEYDCESQTVSCDDDPNIPPDCGPNPEGFCDCILGTNLCQDSRTLGQSDEAS